MGGDLRFFGALATLALPDALAEQIKTLRAKESGVYFKCPFAGPKQVLVILAAMRTASPSPIAA